MFGNPDHRRSSDTGRGASKDDVPLSMVSPGQEVQLVTVEGGRRLLHRLAEMGLSPGACFRIVACGRPGPFIISLKDARLVLGQGMVSRIIVRPA